MSSAANPSTISFQTSLRSYPSIQLQLNPTTDAEAADSEKPLAEDEAQGNGNEEPGRGIVQPSAEDDIRPGPPPNASTASDVPTSTAEETGRPKAEELRLHHQLNSTVEKAQRYFKFPDTVPLLALVLPTICFGYATYKDIGNDSQEHKGWRHNFIHFLGLVLSASLLLYNSFHSLRNHPHLRRNAFDPVHIRLTHPQRKNKATDHQGTPEAGQSRRSRRRIIHWLEQQPHEEYDPSSRKRSFQPNLDTLLPLPFWKTKGLGSLPIISQDVASLARTEVAVQIGDALKGYAPDDRNFSVESPLRIRRRVLQRISGFFRFGYSGDDDDDDIEPPLTALLADLEEEEEGEEEKGPQRNVRITSGVVALGLAQAGCTLASSVGGAIAPDILVQSDVRTDMMAELRPLPSAPQDAGAAD